VSNHSLARSRLFVFVLLLVLLAQGMFPAAAAAQGSLKEHVAVILILDDSGSMHANDPSNLR